jgi:phosphoserine aminotransferase
LPEVVRLEAERAIAELPGAGLSILGVSHRSRAFRAILDEAEDLVRELLGLPGDFRVLFLQGGGTLQFSMVPMAMLPDDGVADYVVGGHWSRCAAEAARSHGRVRVAWNGAPGYGRLPLANEPVGRRDAAYLHYVSNETVEGLQFRWLPATRGPLVCDASSDFLSRPMDMARHSLVYAHAQKNLGPAGVTLVVVRDEVLARRPAGLPPVLDYRAHADARSILHTPPVFAVYVVLLSLRWLARSVGGLTAMAAINARKARILRQALRDAAPFYLDSVERGFESDMNVTFRCPTVELDARFVAEAERAGLVGTEGHRSRGGLRVSLYNGATVDDARAMATFVGEFAHAHRDAGAESGAFYTGPSASLPAAASNMR